MKAKQAPSNPPPERISRAALEEIDEILEELLPILRALS
jgi:hypothetical protein